MKVEIWSDIACPFCYIGKHHFEKALAQFEGKDGVEVEWKSFELNPQAEVDYQEDIYELLATKYGQTKEWAHQACSDMEARGKQVGLDFDFDTNIPTNTFDAHRLTHLAASKGLKSEAKEALFEAHFRDGKHVGHHDTLIEVGESIGLEKESIVGMLNSDQFAQEVRADEQLSQQFGISGVPFFVIDRKYGVSGAQPVESFLEALQKAE